MIRPFSALMTALLLAGCMDGTNPFSPVDAGTGTGTDPDNTTDFSEFSNNVQAVSYNQATGQLLIDLAALDRSDEDYPLVAYVRTPALDQDGYIAYTYQDDQLDRHFTAFVAVTPDGVSRGITVSDGGQFNRFYSGTDFIALEPFSNPFGGLVSVDNGLVSYAGTYVGLTNIDATGDQLLPVSAGVDDSLYPAQSAIIKGEIFLNVDFGDMLVNGAVYHREWVNAPAALVTESQTELDSSTGLLYLPRLILTHTDISDTGEFLGDIETQDLNAIGSYAGVFGGTDATGVAGAIYSDGFLPTRDGEAEYGIFVLVQCGQPGDAAICDQINP